MMIKIPQQINIPHSLTKQVSEETGCTVPYWEISVPRKDDIAWSIVLSYLISKSYRDREDFARRLKSLTGTDKNLNLVKRSIRSFNPFRNRFSCFYIESLRQVVRQFKINLSWDSLSSASEKLSAASALLRCPILLVWQYENTFRSRMYSENTERCLNVITLHSCDSITEESGTASAVHNFLLNHELGLEMQNAVLLYFLEEAKIPKNIQLRVEAAVKSGKHFLISILANNCQKVIPKLYKSPYIVSKLAEAGYETDPIRSKDDEGLSALYHALVLADVKVLYELYYFAANNCFQSEGSFRNPDSHIVTSLLQIEEIFSTDLTKSKDLKHHPNYNDLKKISEDLLRLNKFLFEVNSRILKIKNKLNFCETTDETVFEACKRREIIATILNTYEEFFNPGQQNSTTVSPLDDYVMFKNYYSLIDTAAAVIFFDNIIFLKERLLLAVNNQFSGIESSFFFLVVCHVALHRINIPNVAENSGPFLQMNINSSYIFPLIRRLDNMKKVKEFSQNLQDTLINEENVIKCIPRSEIFGILNSYPTYEDSLHLNRLKSYIKTALTVKVIDIKSVLVIERVLQVIGEYITPKENNDYSFRRFLSLILPKGVSHILRRTRHELSHLRSYAFTAKTESETNFSLFRSIQSEIRAIRHHFKSYFFIQNVSGALLLYKLFEEEVERIRSSTHLYESSSLNVIFLREEITIILKIARLLIFKGCISSYKLLLKTILFAVKNNIENRTSWSRDWESTKNDLLYALWPLKWLIELLQQFGDHRAAYVIDAFETLKNCNENTSTINDLREKTNRFLTKCRDLLSKLITQRKGKKLNPLRSIKNTEHFFKILNSPIFLSKEEKNEIRREIPVTIKQGVRTKEKLKKSIEEGFTLNIDEKSSEFKISYLSNTKMKMFLDLYKNKDLQALAILEMPDPVAELEEAFWKNSIGKNKYETLCRTMQFSDQAKNKLGRLVAGQRKKIPGNKLLNLLNRVQLMKKLLIEENEEVFNLWVKVKRATSRRYITDKIVWHYLRDRQLQASVEMLLFDCMNICENRKGIENPWIKSSKLYRGINMRNVISHGSPLLEHLGELLDREDLKTDMIQKMLRLIESEDAIVAILELFRRINNDSAMLKDIISSNEEGEYFDLTSRIVKCEEWENYTLLLPRL